MFWVITDGKSRFAYGDTSIPENECIFKFKDIVKFLLSMNNPENLEIWYSDGTKKKLQGLTYKEIYLP